MRLNLLTFPNKKLQQKCEEVVDFSTLPPIISNMKRIMREERGAAIAAPQVGVLKRIFVTDQGDVMVNPSWKPSANSSIALLEEGCLSFPGLWIKVQRYTDIDVTYQDINGEGVSDTLNGFAAQVFQHETEHLDGILFIDKLRG